MSGLNKGPQEKFAVYLFCDAAAAGTTIGGINITPGSYVGPESEKFWSNTSSFWQDSRWACDVENFTWSHDGLSLRVKTSPIYGTGKIYTLDLLRREIIKEDK